MIANIKIEFQSPEIAKRVLEAISPDNSPLPVGLTISCRVSDVSLFVKVQCERSIESLGATLEDIMSAIDLSIRTSESVETEDK
ncbi:MAG: KEOPS complex subunit Pcc1 [Candidatus Odinarchaeota archaeon]|nr:KEOPS complex subunit Pcc1 [Candidatus Thorarchaeota archaeon]